MSYFINGLWVYLMQRLFLAQLTNFLLRQSSFKVAAKCQKQSMHGTIQMHA